MERYIEYEMRPKSGGSSSMSYSDAIVKSLSEFFQRDLISIPLVKSYPHPQLSQRCGLKAVTLELDTAGHPNIEYIAGNRLSVYPVNPIEHVTSIMKYLVDDICPAGTSSSQEQQQQQHSSSATRRQFPWLHFTSQFPRAEALKMALLHLFDITTAPSRELLIIMSDCCTKREHKSRLLAISKSEEVWEKWICQSLRTLKSTLDEFNSCTISARRLFSELAPQQPRQYSISSIKSSNRFRTEIVVFQHKFDANQIAASLRNSRERQKMDMEEITHVGPPVMSLKSTTSSTSPLSTTRGQNTGTSQLTSFRSVRSMVPSPISSQQVERVPAFSGPVASLYAMGSSSTHKSLVSAVSSQDHRSSSQSRQPFDGLCSSYLLSLKANDQVLCEFVENPRFTLKGNRERPIMMIGQDIGVVAFRPFWQQRVLEHDRAQVFYTLFKDLKQKKFGDMQLVCLTGHKSKIEELFKQEISSIVTHKIISSATYLNREHLSRLIYQPLGENFSQTDKELLELGQRMAKLLIDQNGCLYTCCDLHMTQAIEILLVESIVRLHPRNPQLTRDRLMTTLLPKWKGRGKSSKGAPANANTTQTNKHNTTTTTTTTTTTNNNNNNNNDNSTFLYTLENSFERAQVVQEIYDTSI